VTSDGDAVCVLCRSEPPSRRGEHVLPSWYLRDQERVGPPPYPWEVNGEPIRDRDGAPIARQERTRVLLPVGEQCNRILERRFETPSKAVVRRLFSARGQVALDASEAATAGLWLAKTLLLENHPAAYYADPVVESHAFRWRGDETPPDRFFTWLVDGSPPPDGLSLWVHRTDEGDEDRRPPEFRLPLPRLTADGTTVSFVTADQSWHGLNTTLVVHPGWSIDHPLERDGRAVRLLPSTGAADLAALPVLYRRTVAWTRCRVTLRDGSAGSPDLPPITESYFPFTALPELLPHVVLWGA